MFRREYSLEDAMNDKRFSYIWHLQEKTFAASNLHICELYNE